MVFKMRTIILASLTLCCVQTIITLIISLSKSPDRVIAAIYFLLLFYIAIPFFHILKLQIHKYTLQTQTIYMGAFLILRVLFLLIQILVGNSKQYAPGKVAWYIISLLIDLVCILVCLQFLVLLDKYTKNAIVKF